MNRTITFIILLFACFYINGQEKSTIIFPENFRENSNYELLEKIEFDFDEDGLVDTLNLYKIENWNDPGDFQQLHLIFGSGKQLKMYDLGNWIGLKKRLSTFQKENLLKSNNLLYYKLSDHQKLLILFGYTYASSPGQLTIIDITLPEPAIVFNSEFEIREFKELDKNGIKEIIGQRYSHQPYASFDSTSYVGTYAPYFVLKYEKDTLRVDTVLSQKYNDENYVGFYGFSNPSRRFDVIYPFKKYKTEPFFQFEIYRKYPFTSLRKLQVSDLVNYTNKELKIMRNEIFAFHGFRFKSEDMKIYFGEKEWYEPIENNNLIELNSIEKFNVNLIKKIENNNR